MSMLVFTNWYETPLRLRGVADGTDVVVA